MTTGPGTGATRLVTEIADMAMVRGLDREVVLRRPARRPQPSQAPTLTPVTARAGLRTVGRALTAPVRSIMTPNGPGFPPSHRCERGPAAGQPACGAGWAEGNRGARFSVSAAAPSRTSGPMKQSIS